MKPIAGLYLFARAGLTRAPEQDESGRILEILRAAKNLAQEYRRLTEKPLEITGEMAEYEAAGCSEWS